MAVELERDILYLGRLLSTRISYNEDIISLRQINSTFFTRLYNSLPSTACSQLTPLGINERTRCQLVIDSLKRLLPPQVSLSHIKGKDIAKGDLTSIKNLLQIFSVLLELSYTSDDDSNLISNEGQKVVNEVLEQELDSSSIYIPTTLDSTHSSTIAPPIQSSNSTHSPFKTLPTQLSDSAHSPFKAPPIHLSDSTHSSLITPPTHPLSVTPPTHPLLTCPLDQSTPHQGPKSRLNLVNNNKIVPSLSISSLSTTPTPTKQRPHPPLHSISPTTTSDDSSIERVTLLENKEENEEEIEEKEGETKDEQEDKERREKTEGETEEVEETEDETEEETEEEENKGNYSKTLSNKLVDEIILQKLYHNYITRQDSNLKPSSLKGKTFSTTAERSLQYGNTKESSPNAKLLQSIEEAFPGLSVSPSLQRKLWHQKMRQLKAHQMSRPLFNSSQKKIDEMEIKRKGLLDLLKKELNHNKRMHSLSVKRQQDKALKITLQSQRQIVARSQRYYKDYSISIHRKLQRERTKENQILKKAFEDCLKIQKDNKLELQRYAKEKEQLASKKHQEELESLQTFYENQLTLIAETIEKEQKETEAREKENRQMSKQSVHKLRKRMEEEIQELWSSLDQWEEDNAHFRQCDKELYKDRHIRKTGGVGYMTRGVGRLTKL